MWIQPKIKVCGITNTRQAQELDQLGIDYIGLNFWKESRRYVDPDSLLPDILDITQAQTIGIFVNASVQEIEEISEQLDLKGVQLHGQEDSGYIENLKKKLEIPIIKAIPVGESLPDLTPFKAADYLLFDTQTGSQFGGSGKSFNWKLLTDVSPADFFVAGGIGPQNIKAAVEQCRPYAVDLNSKVELKPGVKNMLLVKHCLTELGIDFDEES